MARLLDMKSVQRVRTNSLDSVGGGSSNSGISAVAYLPNGEERTINKEDTHPGMDGDGD